MRIIHISDTHNKQHDFPYKECDVLVHSGDFTNDGSEEEILAALRWISEYPASHKLLLPGNHDYLFHTSPQEMKIVCSELSITPIHQNTANIDNTVFYGFPWIQYQPEWSWPDHHRAWCISDPSFWSKALRLIPEDTNILITHQIPLFLGDSVHRNSYWEKLGELHPGNLALRSYIDIRPELSLMLGGHIHENPGIQLHNTTWISNASGSMAEIDYNPESGKVSAVSIRKILDFPSSTPAPAPAPAPAIDPATGIQEMKNHGF